MIKISAFEMFLAFKLLRHGQGLLRRDLFFALGGLALGVATLLTSMSIMSGYESTLQKAVTDVTGHAQIVRRGRNTEGWKELEDRIRKETPDLKGAAPFVYVEGILAHQGKISGSIVQGIEISRLSDVTSLENRVILGQMLGDESKESIKENIDEIPAMVGKGIFKNFNLKLGDILKVVIPISDAYDPQRFQRNVGALKIVGVIDLGKYEWNERLVLMDLKAVQKLAQIGEKYSGLILSFESPNEALKSAKKLESVFGSSYWVRGWRDLNENLFQAVEIERIVVFFVVLLIVIVAAFNMTSFLYVHVLRRYEDIAIFKTLGLGPKSLIKIFTFQGVLFAILGIFSGLILGQIFMWIVPFLIQHYGLIEGSVYNIENIDLKLRFWDMIAVIFSSLLICFFATLAPAVRGSKLKPVEGLRYG